MSSQKKSKTENHSGSSDGGSGELPVPVAPDGGWGWVVTFASFMVSFLVDGVCFTFGIFFPEFLRHFGGSKGKTSFLGSALNGSYLTLGPIAGALVNRFGCRKVAIVGAITSSLGLLLSSFSPNLDVMILLYGFVGGGGFGLIYLPAIVMVGYYFDKRRAFATGIAVCGSGIGGFVFAPLCVLLLETYGWQGAIWIMAGIVLNGIVFASFYRPLHSSTTKMHKPKCETNGQTPHCDAEERLFSSGSGSEKPTPLAEFEMRPIYRCKSEEIKCAPNGNSHCTARLAFSQDLSALERNGLHPHKHVHKEHLNPLARKDIFFSGSLHNIPEHQTSKSRDEYVKKMTVVIADDTLKAGCCEKIQTSLSTVFDFSLLSSPTFIVYGLSCFLCMFGFFIPFNFLPSLAKDLGLTKSQGALLISLISISNTVSRIVVGFISDQSWADCLLINNISLLIGGAITCLVPFYGNFAILAAYTIIFGAAIAAFVSLRSIIMVELMGIERLTNAFALVVLCQGLSSFIGSPVAGSLADLTGDYNIAFYLSGATLALGGLICFPLRRISAWERGRAKQKEYVHTEEQAASKLI